MPLATERLTRRSSKEAIDRAISECVSQLADEHPNWERKRVIAACISDARRHSGSARVPKNK